MFSSQEIHTYLVRSLELAHEAFKRGDYPIGAIVVNAQTKESIEALNTCKSSVDITAHAEMILLRQLGERADKHASPEHYLFTSLEPCFGCSFFIARSNISHIYSVLKDPHKGGMSDLSLLPQFVSFFTKISIINGIDAKLANESKALMHEYFLQIGNNKAAACYQKTP
jgi:tRNA(adenine34) deaminase